MSAALKVSVALFVPSFGVNGPLYNTFRALFAPLRDYHLEARVAEYNRLLAASGLPLLLSRFAQLDMNGDGNADRQHFTSYSGPGGWPDDGVHPNQSGERIFANSLADAVVAAIERGR